MSGMRIFSYCLMDNHYHLVLENHSGRLSYFLRQLNGHYGQYYRIQCQSRGYVFQSRFHSSLIQDESYLILAILYVLRNPVKSGQVKFAFDYPWSSARAIFKGPGPDWLEADFVQNLFGSRQSFAYALLGSSDEPLPLIKTRLGPMIGSEDFVEEAAAKFDRRKNPADDRRRRGEDRFFEPSEKVIQEFERKHKIKIADIDCSSLAGKRLRAELLVWLHDMAGMKYWEIMEIPLFFSLKAHSLGNLYKQAARRAAKK